MSDPHKIRITVPKGVAVLTRIELDGQELVGVERIDLHMVRGLAMVTLTLYADVEIEGELDIVKEWRRRRPSLLRRLLPARFGQ